MGIYVKVDVSCEGEKKKNRKEYIQDCKTGKNDLYLRGTGESDNRWRERDSWWFGARPTASTSLKTMPSFLGLLKRECQNSSLYLSLPTKHAS